MSKCPYCDGTGSLCGPWGATAPGEDDPGCPQCGGFGVTDEEILASLQNDEDPH